MAYKDPNDPRAKLSRNKHYSNNKAVYKANARKHSQEKLDHVRVAKDKPCHDCGCTYPFYVMEFDHVPERGSKSFGMNYAHYQSWDNLRSEIEKCDVVCSNCHRQRTYRRASAGHPTDSKPEG